MKRNRNENGFEEWVRSIKKCTYSAQNYHLINYFFRVVTWKPKKLNLNSSLWTKRLIAKTVLKVKFLKAFQFSSMDILVCIDRKNKLL